MLLWFGSLLFNIGDDGRVSELKKTIIFLQEKLGVRIERLRVEVPMAHVKRGAKGKNGYCKTICTKIILLCSTSWWY